VARRKRKGAAEWILAKSATALEAQRNIARLRETFETTRPYNASEALETLEANESFAEAPATNETLVHITGATSLPYTAEDFLSRASRSELRRVWMGSL
jgi:hypothetical protein